VNQVTGGTAHEEFVVLDIDCLLFRVCAGPLLVNVGPGNGIISLYMAMCVGSCCSALHVPMQQSCTTSSTRLGGGGKVATIRCEKVINSSSSFATTIET